MRPGVRRLLPALTVLGAFTFAFAPGAQADGGAAWRFEPALAPPPPPGVAPAPYGVPLGEVGQISFWAPDRGLLITGGTEKDGGTVPAGLYAYDGAHWHLLSSVCGGSSGRIAWAGPDDFWTISDQRPGQAIDGVEVENELPARSLCHFVDGRVVASYAEPLGQPNSYLRMDAAACYSSNDCWFAGANGEAPNVGSFHLHWDGSTLSAIYDASDHAVTGMVNFGGQLYEGLGIGPQDTYLPTEEPHHPAALRQIAPVGAAAPCEGIPSTFCDVFAFWQAAEQPLPVYPKGVAPDGLVGFNLASDGSPLGVGATEMWAGADPATPAPQGAPPASVTVLRDRQGEWTQVLPVRETEGKPVPSPLGEAALAGASSYVSPERHNVPGAGAIAPVPGGESAWLSLRAPSADAVLALLGPHGEVKLEHLPTPEDPVGVRGQAGPIACAAPNDCWMATTEGWLFHLSDGASHGIDTDPNFAGVISVRPPDDGLPAVYPDLPPLDDSLANQQPAPPPNRAPEQTPAPVEPKHRSRPLVVRVKSRFLHRRVLVLSFTLTARARVQLLGRRGRRVVASTAPASLRPGRHTLSLGFDPRRWPTKLQFKAKPIGTG